MRSDTSDFESPCADILHFPRLWGLVSDRCEISCLESFVRVQRARARPTEIGGCANLPRLRQLSRRTPDGETAPAISQAAELRGNL